MRMRRGDAHTHTSHTHKWLDIRRLDECWRIYHNPSLWFPSRPENFSSKSCLGRICRSKSDPGTVLVNRTSNRSHLFVIHRNIFPKLSTGSRFHGNSSSGVLLRVQVQDHMEKLKFERNVYWLNRRLSSAKHGSNEISSINLIYFEIYNPHTTYIKVSNNFNRACLQDLLCLRMYLVYYIQIHVFTVHT